MQKCPRIWACFISMAGGTLCLSFTYWNFHCTMMTGPLSFVFIISHTLSVRVGFSHMLKLPLYDDGRVMSFVFIISHSHWIHSQPKLVLAHEKWKYHCMMMVQNTNKCTHIHTYVHHTYIYTHIHTYCDLGMAQRFSTDFCTSLLLEKRWKPLLDSKLFCKSQYIRFRARIWRTFRCWWIHTYTHHVHIHRKRTHIHTYIHHTHIHTSIHTSGFVQGYGVLLVVDEQSSLTIIGCSQNSSSILNKPADQVFMYVCIYVWQYVCPWKILPYSFCIQQKSSVILRMMNTQTRYLCVCAYIMCVCMSMKNLALHSIKTAALY